MDLNQAETNLARRLGLFDATMIVMGGIIGAGIIPGALEMLDQLILGAVEQAFHFGFPLDAGAVRGCAPPTGSRALGPSSHWKREGLRLRFS